ncbi:MAG: hypothetical protein ACPGO3_00420 [Magnetospiraceae bacterium]
MLKINLADERRFKAKVTVQTPQESGGKRECSFTAHFRVLTYSEQEEILERNPGGADFQILKTALVGWGDDLQDEEGQPIPFTDDTLRAILDIPYIRMAMYRAFIAGNTGTGRTKN